MKKKIITFGSIVASLSPIIAISCSTGWRHWKKGNDKPSHTVFPHDKASPTQYQVRSDAILEEAWDDATKTLNLEKINNYFELYTLLGKKINVFATSRIDSLWEKKNWTKLNDYFKNILSDFSVTLKTSTTTSRKIQLSLSSPINEIDQGFKNYVGNLAPTDVIKTVNGVPILFKKGMDLSRAYDVEFDGLNSLGQPVDFANVAIIGVPLLNQPIVKSLLDIDGSFALSMSKLVNIPQGAFDGIPAFFARLLPFFNAIINSSEVESWAKEKQVTPFIDVDGKVKFDDKDASSVAQGQMIRYWLGPNIRSNKNNI